MRSKYIGFFVDPEFRKLIEKVLDISKQNLSEYIRDLIRNDLIHKGLINFKNIENSVSM